MRLEYVNVEEAVAMAGGRAAVAERMGISRQNMTKLMQGIERGENITERSAGRLAKAVGVTLRDLRGSFRPAVAGEGEGNQVSTL